MGSFQICITAKKYQDTVGASILSSRFDYRCSEIPSIVLLGREVPDIGKLVTVW
ncbi:hypothetical protein ACVIDN_001839 [Rhizobium brockwellii]